MLKLRPIEQSKIIWVDPDINQNPRLMELFNEAKEDRELDCPFEGFENIDDAMEALSNTVKAVVITSG